MRNAIPHHVTCLYINIRDFIGEVRMTGSVKVTPWPDENPPSRDELWRRMVDEGLDPYAWSNGPHDIYAAHTHNYDKVIYVISGSITFGLPELQRNLTLFPGDRLDLPKGTLHDAMVGREGVVCLEGHC
jgi:mannose-6-phosphate isomerase-like protein (cupin superfamily)